jgi:hypothetical protein
MKMDRILVFLKTRIDEYDIALIKELLLPLDDTLNTVVKWYVNNRISTGLAYWIREGYRENRIDDAFDEETIMFHLGLFNLGVLNDKEAMKKHLDLLFYGLRGH